MKLTRTMKNFVLLSAAAAAVLLCMAISVPGHEAVCREDDLLLQNVVVTAAAGIESRTPGQKTVYLTFDDGPSKVTEDILNVLKAQEVQASFFVATCDDNTEYLPTLKRIAEEGHCIALHTASHKYNKIYASPDAFWDDQAKLRDVLLQYEVTPCEVMRFPGGSNNTVSRKAGGTQIMETLRTQAEEKGIYYLDWNVSADDSVGHKKSAKQIYENVIKGAANKDTCVVLMHDIRFAENTAKALPDIIRWFKNAGYTFGTVDIFAKK